METNDDPVWLRLIPSSLKAHVIGRKSLQAVIQNSSWLLADKLIRGTLGLLVGAWVARYLGPAQFGELAYVLAYLAFFQVMASLGLDGIVVREIARDYERAGQILGTAFALRLLVGVFCWIFAVGGMLFFNGWQDRSVWLTALAGGSLVFQAADTIDLWFQSQSQSRRTVVAKLAAYFLSNAIRVFLIISEAPLLAFAAVLFLDAITATIGLWFAYRRFPCRGKWLLIISIGKQLLGDSWPFMCAGFINMFQARIEYLLIETMLGKESLGQYVAALRFIELFDVVGAVIAVSIFPRVAGLAPNEADSAMRKIYLSLFLVYISCLPLLLFLWWLIGLVYGAQYAVAQSIFLTMAFRPLLAYLGMARSLAIKIDNKSWYALFSSSIGGIVAASLGLALIPRLGLLGAVFSGLMSYAVSNFLLDFFFYKKNFLNIIRCYKN